MARDMQKGHGAINQQNDIEGPERIYQSHFEVRLVLYTTVIRGIYDQDAGNCLDPCSI